MDTGTITLAEFLLARIAEDEATASRIDCACDGPTEWQAGCPDRIVADCETGRLVVRFLSDLERGNYSDPTASSVAYSVMCRLAAVHMDHPDFDLDWRP